MNYYVEGYHCCLMVFSVRGVMGVVFEMERANVSPRDFHTIRPATDDEWKKSLVERWPRLIDVVYV